MHAFMEGGGYEKWIGELGIRDAPLVRAGLGEALRFFHMEMPDLPRTLRFAFLKGMDLHKPVTVATLQPGEVLAAFRRSTEDPLKLFYSRPGTSVLGLGVNPGGRAFQRFRVVHRVRVLDSVAAAARDTWTDDSSAYIAAGGGRQYIVPRAYRCLEVLSR
jgi:hypothetical protein